MIYYTARFTKNGKKYAYKTTNFKVIKKILRKIKSAWYGCYDDTWFM